MFKETIMRNILLAAAAVWSVTAGASMAAPAAGRPPLYLHEPRQVTTRVEEAPLTQAAVTSGDLELHAFGGLGLSGLPGANESSPPHTYSGLCPTACGMTLSKKGSYADLTGFGRIRWNTKMSGFHQIRPLIKLADGTWLVGDHATGVIGPDWLVTEFNTADLRWIKFDMERKVTVGLFLPKVDLSRVEEIGYVDLMRGSGHGQGGWSDIGLIEVYAGSSPR